MTTTHTPPSWCVLLEKAISEPGMIASAYTRFHNYSMGNQLLAMFQCLEREIQPGPIGTFMHWKELGRHVKKGEKAITLCMPITGKGKKTETDDAGNETETEFGYTRFIYRNNWFVLAQTEGEAYSAPDAPAWDESAALAALNVTREEFNLTDGNTQGCAKDRSVHISPVAEFPMKTLFHEIAHVVLGHTAEGSLNDGAERTPRDIRELEAESVAMLCCESLGLGGAEFSRGYIQSWFKGNTVPEKSAQKIFKAADQILKAGCKIGIDTTA